MDLNQEIRSLVEFRKSRLRLLLLFLFSFVIILSLAGCGESDNSKEREMDKYADFECHSDPIIETFSEVGLSLGFYEFLGISFTDGPQTFTLDDVIYLEIENLSEVSI